MPSDNSKITKKTIGVFFGSRSPEHDVSIITAIASIMKPLEAAGKYNVVPIYITKDGVWYSDDALKNVSLYSSGKIDGFIKNHQPVQLLIQNGLTLIKPGLRSQRTKIDIAFPATHGANGEDGALMGVFRMANIPFVGCDVAASSIAMDKLLAKEIAVVNDIPTPRYVAFTASEFATGQKELLQRMKRELTLPVFVKPARLGSSIGITRVVAFDHLENAIEVALHYDDKVVVEEGVANLIEVTVPVIGNEEPQAALVEQPLVNPEEFFDFYTKYMHGGKKGGGKQMGGTEGSQGYSKLPADIPKTLYDRAVETALRVYKAMDCGGIARVDLLINSKTGIIYFNELNPLPGSLYEHNWRRCGITPVELVTRLITFAEERHAHKAELESVFQTNFLKQF